MKGRGIKFRKQNTIPTINKAKIPDLETKGTLNNKINIEYFILPINIKYIDIVKVRNESEWTVWVNKKLFSWNIFFRFKTMAGFFIRNISLCMY